METNILPKLRRHPEFRGQSVDTGEWVYGSLLDHTLPDGSFDYYAAIGVPYQDEISIRLKPIPVKVETVGEFVGFYYGFKVFEDDIIHLKGTQITVNGNIHDRPELWKGK